MPTGVEEAVAVFSTISSVVGPISYRNIMVPPQVDFDNYSIWFRIKEMYQQELNNEVVIALMSIRQAISAGPFMGPGVNEIQAVDKYLQSVNSSLSTYWNDPFAANATRPAVGQDILYDLWVNPGKFRDKMITALNILPKFGYWWEFDYLLQSGVPKKPNQYLEYINSALRQFYPVKFTPTGTASFEVLQKPAEEANQTKPEDKKKLWWLLLFLPFV